MLHSFFTSLDRNRKYERMHLHDGCIFSWNGLCILYEALMIDYRSWHLSEKYAAVVAKKRDSPQAIVVSRVQARPIQIETREKSWYASAFVSLSSASCYRQNSLACGNSSSIIGDIVGFRVRFCLQEAEASRSLSLSSYTTPVERMLLSVGSRSFSSAEKAGDKREKQRDRAWSLLYAGSRRAAPRRRIRTGRTRP